MILRACEHRQMIWKNGGGITNEIARQPEDNEEEFHWRLSMASIKPPGGLFSRYPNIDRTLCIIDGLKLTLNINDNDLVICLDQNSPPFSFPGELSITSQTDEETVIDLNVMTKRDIFQHTVQRHTFKGDQHPMNISITNEDDVLFVVVAQGNLQMHQSTVEKGDAIRINHKSEAIEISSVTETSIIYLVTIVKLFS